MMHERDTSYYLCVGHKFSEMEIALIFTNGMKSTTSMLLDASVGGTMKNKTAVEI
jgi:hypothetical protein